MYSPDRLDPVYTERAPLITPQMENEAIGLTRYRFRYSNKVA
jgi:hypothetical protein